MMKKFNYIPIQLIIPEGRLPKKVKDGCEYIDIGYYLGRNVVVGLLENSISRGSELAIWNDIRPDNGKYLFEVIVELPFFLPNFKKSFEYDLSIGNKTYFINNRHCEIITDEKNKYIFAHYNAIPSLQKQGKKISQVIKLKSLVSSSFIVESNNASDVIEREFFNWIEVLGQDIPQIISTLRYCTDKSPELIPDCANIENTCPIYVLCKGEEGKIGLLRFVKHINVSPLQPISHIGKTTKPTIENYLAGVKVLDEGKALLLKSKQLYESGEYPSCCIIACTACEVIMTKHLRFNLQKKGLGKKRIKEAIDNLTFSQLIKLTSYFVYSSKDGIREALNKIDKMRKIRNSIVHEGMQLTKAEVSIIQSCFESIELISKHK